LGGNFAASRTRVGINNNAPAFILDINEITNTYGGGIGLRTGGNSWEILHASTTNFWFNYNGALSGWISSATGAYTAVSDKRMKTNIKPMESILGKVMKMQPSRYEYNRNNPAKIQSIGFLAQDVEPLFPEVVNKEKLENDTSGLGEIYGIDYAGLSVVAIKAIQEQQKIIEQQNADIELLKQQMEELKQLIKTK